MNKSITNKLKTGARELLMAFGGFVPPIFGPSAIEDSL